VSWQYFNYGWNACGGTIYSSEVIITAAHCCESLGDDNYYKIIAGEQDLDTQEPSEQRRSVTSFIMHPDYDTDTLENDICLLFLSSPLNLTGSYAKSLPLATEGSVITNGTECFISGWGSVIPVSLDSSTKL